MLKEWNELKMKKKAIGEIAENLSLLADVESFIENVKFNGYEITDYEVEFKPPSFFFTFYAVKGSASLTLSLPLHIVGKVVEDKESFVEIFRTSLLFIEKKIREVLKNSDRLLRRLSEIGSNLLFGKVNAKDAKMLQFKYLRILKEETDEDLEFIIKVGDELLREDVVIDEIVLFKKSTVNLKEGEKELLTGSLIITYNKKGENEKKRVVFNPYDVGFILKLSGEVFFAKVAEVLRENYQKELEKNIPLLGFDSLL